MPPPENAGLSIPGPVMGEAEVTEKTNIGSKDPTGMKQAPNRKMDNPMKLASATPKFHNARKGHKPSARDPMQVFKRIARGHISAEEVRKRDVMKDHTERFESETDELLAELKDIKKKT